ncbi:MAG: tetratricopeptide repeat protein [Methylobacterium frigidaeris]
MTGGRIARGGTDDGAGPSLERLRRMTPADWTALLADGGEEALAWIRLAAGHGFRSAQVVLGQICLDGALVRRDPDAAFGWFSRAAHLGSVEAVNMVGRCHELGWGVPPDHAEAMRHYRRAAEAGHAWGQYNLGTLLLYGDGVPRDHAAARAWFGRAAARDHAKAMGMLGRFCEEGWAGPVDAGAAARWYRRAAEGGDDWARFNLGRLLAEAGRRDEALVWLGRAVAGGGPNCLRMIGPALLRHGDPAFRALGTRALQRCAGRAPAGPARRRRPLAGAAAGLWMLGMVRMGGRPKGPRP